MGWNNIGFVLIVVLAAAAEVAVPKAAAATYVVADSFGWGVPPAGPATYTTWASQHTFTQGDVLLFNFGTGMHNVAQVTKAEYDACTSTNPITLQATGPATLTINSSSGQLYYICTFGQHCALGQKLAINVTAASTSPAIAPSPMSTTPSSSSSSSSPVSMAHSPGPSTTTPSPSPSPSATTVAAICMPFLAIALAAYAFFI